MTDLNAFLPYVNGPLDFLFRHALWIPDRRHKIARIDPNAYHLTLGNGAYRCVMYINAQHSQAAYKNLNWFMRSAHAWDMAALRPNFGFDTYSEQPDETDGIDTFIVQEGPTNNHGTDDTLEIGEQNSALNLSRTLIKYDFSQLPPLYVADDGTLSLWLFANYAANARTFRMYRQKRAWVETQATWNIYSTGNSWTTVGGYSSSDSETTEVAAKSLGAAESGGEKQWTIDQASLETMMNGIFTNNGWIIKADTEVNDQHRFRSSSYATAGNRPKLVFTYYPQDSGGLLL